MANKRSIPPFGDTVSPSERLNRRRVTRACDNCKSRKRRCTGDLPCTACQAIGVKCTYLASYTRGKIVRPLPATSTALETQLPALPVSSIQYSIVSSSDEEAHGLASGTKSPENSTNHAGQYLGPSSPYNFLRRAWERFENNGSNANSAADVAVDPKRPESIFAFGDRQPPLVELDNFTLPAKSVATQFFAQYFDFCMPTYRIFHKPTVDQWLDTYYELHENGTDRAELTPSHQAVILMILATARIFNIGDDNDWLSPDDDSHREGEMLFRMGQIQLEKEHGRVKLESVQARLVEILYLLHTSRPNQAWYKIGTAVQVSLALGLHRSTSATPCCQDKISIECRKRVFWATFMLDTYLGVMLGRPAFIHLDDVDQMFPDLIDDEALTSEGTVPMPHGKDSVIRASIKHGQITTIVKKAAQEQHSIRRKSSQQKLETASKLNAEITDWHSALPIMLSGAIHPTSLIPIFRRQATVLQLAHGHALMLINRPSLLMDTAQLALKTFQVETCLMAAKSTLDTILATSLSKPLFQAFWYTQFVCFNALSIVYVWQILRKQGRLPEVASISEQELVKVADTVQQLLHNASKANAPSLRYSIVLQELQQEVRRMDRATGQRPPLVNGPMEESTNRTTVADSTRSTEVNQLLEILGTAEPPPAQDFLVDPDLWLSLDSFPFSDFGQLG